MAKTFNIFISHSWRKSDEYERLFALLDQRKYFNFRNHSVPQTKPVETDGTDEDLAAALKRQMSGSHVVLILAGKYASYRHWIKEEIAMAQNGFSNPKPIIAIKPHRHTQLSAVVSEAADIIVPWRTEAIVAAIRQAGAGKL